MLGSCGSACHILPQNLGDVVFNFDTWRGIFLDLCDEQELASCTPQNEDTVI